MTICPFHIGRAGDDCKRCGATWAEHALKARGVG
jgi:hypothetical protein